MDDKILKKAEELGAEYCDLRKVHTSGLSLEVKDGELKKAVPGDETGLSIRILVAGAWGFSATSDLELRQVTKALERAVKLAKSSSKHITEPVKLQETKILNITETWKPEINPMDITIEDKFELISDMDKRIHEFDNILTVTTSYSENILEMEFLSTEGANIRTLVPRTAVQANLIARKQSDVVGYRTRIAGTMGYEVFKKYDPITKGEYAAAAANRILTGKPCPSGSMTLVCDPSLTGVFVHEALGHAVEADQIVTHESVLDGRLGETIAAEMVTVVDDSTIPGGFGSFPVDDEGVLGSRKVLIENGVLRDYICNRETAYKLELEPNGGARAESYQARPLVRMSNTLIEGGDQTFEELIEDIKHGIFAKGTRGGQVDTAKGTFQFNAQEAFLIENGKITTPLKDVSLAGDTLEILKNIDAMTKTSEFGEPGYCGKGQFVPVGDGGPNIRIKSARVGGL
ncbi:TldD/PmbA family protein [[Eubacterium] cellulosolvens]